MLTLYYFSVRDNSDGGQGIPIKGLTPGWALFVRLDTAAPITPQPSISEIGMGIYTYHYDPEIGDAAGQVDALAGNTTVTLMPGDRYIDVFPTREASILLSQDSTGWTGPVPVVVTG